MTLAADLDVPKIWSAGADELFFMKQYIGNACGTIALIHLVANRPELKLDDDSVLGNFIRLTRSLTPEKRGEALQADESFRKIHAKVAQAGQTVAPSTEEAANVDLHFVALVPVNGKIWELDGRKAGPVCHGLTSDDAFLADGVKVCKAFMEANPEENRFTIVALAKQ